MIFELDVIVLIDLDRLALENAGNAIIAVVETERRKSRGARNVDKDILTGDVGLEGKAAEGHAELNTVLSVRQEASELFADILGARTAVSGDRHFRRDDLRELFCDRPRKTERLDLVVRPFGLIDIHIVPADQGALHLVGDDGLGLEAVIDHAGRNKNIFHERFQPPPKII